MSEALRQLLATKSEDLATNINDSELEWMVAQGICFTGALEAVTLVLSAQCSWAQGGSAWAWHTH